MISPRNLTTIAVIAALYVALTFLFEPISFNIIQFRVSEMLTVLPFFTPLAIPGLFIGTLLANLMSPVGPADVIFGSLATLLAAWLTSKMPNKWLAPLPPVIVNAIIIGIMLVVIANLQIGMPAAILYVGLGEAGVCYTLGIALLFMIEKYRKVIPGLNQK